MMGVDGQILLKMFNEWALQEYGQRDDINWLGIDGKSLKNTRKNPNNEQQNLALLFLVGEIVSIIKSGK